MSQGPLKIATPCGNLFFTAIRDDHIYVYAGHDLNDPLESPEGGREGPVTVNRVVYAVSAHYYKWSDGKWHLGEEGKDSYHSLYISRGDWRSFGLMLFSILHLTFNRNMVDKLLPKAE